MLSTSVTMAASNVYYDRDYLEKVVSSHASQFPHVIQPVESLVKDGNGSYAYRDTSIVWNP